MVMTAINCFAVVYVYTQFRTLSKTGSKYILGKILFVDKFLCVYTCFFIKRSDCIRVYGSTTKGGVVKRSDCILVYGSTTKGDVV